MLQQLTSYSKDGIKGLSGAEENANCAIKLKFILPILVTADTSITKKCFIAQREVG